MHKIIDLSHPITHQMKVFPADPAVGVLTHHHYENGYFVSQLVIGTHTGTHVDAPIHKIPGAKSITEMGLGKYIAFRAAVIDCPQPGEGGEITVALLEKAFPAIDGCDGILLRTGWGRHFGSNAFFEGYSGLAEDVAKYMTAHGLHLIGLESPSVHPVRHQEVHTAFLEKGIAVVESLANLQAISKPVVEFYAAPLKLEGLDGSPTRAFAVERE